MWTILLRGKGTGRFCSSSLINLLHVHSSKRPTVAIIAWGRLRRRAIWYHTMSLLTRRRNISLAFSVKLFSSAHADDYRHTIPSKIKWTEFVCLFFPSSYIIRNTKITKFVKEKEMVPALSLRCWWREKYGYTSISFQRRVRKDILHEYAASHEKRWDIVPAQSIYKKSTHLILLNFFSPQRRWLVAENDEDFVAPFLWSLKICYRAKNCLLAQQEARLFPTSAEQKGSSTCSLRNTEHLTLCSPPRIHPFSYWTFCTSIASSGLPICWNMTPCAVWCKVCSCFTRAHAVTECKPYFSRTKWQSSSRPPRYYAAKTCTPSENVEAQRYEHPNTSNNCENCLQSRWNVLGRRGETPQIYVTLSCIPFWFEVCTLDCDLVKYRS